MVRPYKTLGVQDRDWCGEGGRVLRLFRWNLPWSLWSLSIETILGGTFFRPEYRIQNPHSSWPESSDASGLSFQNYPLMSLWAFGSWSVFWQLVGLAKHRCRFFFHRGIGVTWALNGMWRSDRIDFDQRAGHGRVFSIKICAKWPGEVLKKI